LISKGSSPLLPLRRSGFQVITLDDVPRRGRIAALVVGLNEHEIYYVPVATSRSVASSSETCCGVLPQAAACEAIQAGLQPEGDYCTAIAWHRAAWCDWDLLVAAYLLNSGVRSPSSRRSPRTFTRSIEAARHCSAAARLRRPATRSTSAAAAFFGERMRVMLELAPRLESELDRLGNAELFRDLEMPLSLCWPRWSSPGCRSICHTAAGLPGVIRPTAALDQEIADVANGRSTSTRRSSWQGFSLKTWTCPAGGRPRAAYSTDATVLEGLRDQHPVIPKILEFRQLSKLKAHTSMPCRCWSMRRRIACTRASIRRSRPPAGSRRPTRIAEHSNPDGSRTESSAAFIPGRPAMSCSRRLLADRATRAGPHDG